MNSKNNYFVYVGFVFLGAYLLQLFLKVEWLWLNEMQLDENYKRWSGLALGLFIFFQWVLTLSRVIKKFRKYSIKVTQLHKWIGAVSPLIFYIHSVKLGYGYLLLLSSIFLSNMLLGNVNLDFIKSQKEWLFKSWMIVHVTLSVVITFLVLFHIGTVFYYK